MDAEPAGIYYEGKPCVHGHGTTRYVANRMCVECAKGAQKWHRAKHPEACRAQKSAYYQKNSEDLSRKNREWRVATLEVDPHYYRRARYSWAPGEDFETIYARQDGKCEGCGTKLMPGRETHVDHDHTTNAVRGLLCKHCNLALGHVFDDPVRLRALANYLEKRTT